MVLFNYKARGGDIMIESDSISKKSSLLTTLLLLTLGSAGIHRIYVGRYISGIIIFVIKSTYFVINYLGYKWNIVLNVACFGILLFDLYGLYSNSFTDGKGKIITDDNPDIVYDTEKDRMQKRFSRTCNNIMCILTAIAFYIIYFIIYKYLL